MSYTSSPDISITHTYLTAPLELYCALKTHSYVCAFSNVRFPYFVDTSTLDKDASDGYQPVAHVVRNIFRSLSSAVWSGAMWGVERRRVEEKGIRNGVICPKAVWRARVIALSLILLSSQDSCPFNPHHDGPLCPRFLTSAMSSRPSAMPLTALPPTL